MNKLESELSKHIWDTKYRYRKGDFIIDQSLDDTWQRVAKALAENEGNNKDRRTQEFYEVLKSLKFLPGGRILAGAGTEHRVTLFNCFVMGIIEDSIPSIFENLKEGALTMQQGGGIGFDFSTLRPKGSVARSSNNISSGPVSFMKIWDAMCATMLSTGARRGAMMATLRCDHPDIMEFVTAKQEPGILTNFNLSVLVSDRFMEAVDKGAEWPLIFPVRSLDWGHSPDTDTIQRIWSGSEEPVSCKVMDTIPARKLWETIIQSTYEYAEPGVLFIDRINEKNNLRYCEQISAANPCGEVPLPPYGACDLGSLNLTQFVTNPFTDKAGLDLKAIRDTARTAVRMLDNVIDISRFPLNKQREQAYRTRRIGLGIMGLADALIMLKLHYGSSEGRRKASEIMKTICHTAYRTSIELAKEKGTFPLFNKEAYTETPFIKKLPHDIRNDIASSGIRNSHLISIAPTGSISILANNVSNGLEPVFDFKYSRKVLNIDGSRTTHVVTDYAYRQWNKMRENKATMPDYFVSATQLTPDQHLLMQAALQPYVDHSISKTINVPEDFSFESFKNVYRSAYFQGLKGCTTFRPNSVTGAVLEQTDGETQVHCCTLERETD